MAAGVLNQIIIKEVVSFKKKLNLTALFQKNRIGRGTF